MSVAVGSGFECIVTIEANLSSAAAWSLGLLGLVLWLAALVLIEHAHDLSRSSARAGAQGKDDRS
jgi:hypothetical protein